jgi:hypothetical protein
MLTAEPRDVRAGDAVTVTGGGCQPGHEVHFELYNPDLQSSAAGVVRGDGTFVQSITLAPSTQVGPNRLRATCLTPESVEKVMEAALEVSRPEFVIAWTNVIFGAGAALITSGIGLAMLRRPSRRRRSTSRRHVDKRRRRKKRRT